MTSHPNPELVSRYMVPGTKTYQAERSMMARLRDRGWHLAPRPTDVARLAVAMLPHITRPGSSQPLRVDGHVAFEPAVVNLVLNLTRCPYLNGKGAVVGHSAGEGEQAFVVTLVEGQTGQWRIYSITARAQHTGPKGEHVDTF